MKIYHYLRSKLTNWEKTCFGPIRSLFAYYQNKFSSQNNVQDDMKKFSIYNFNSTVLRFNSVHIYDVKSGIYLQLDNKIAQLHYNI